MRVLLKEGAEGATSDSVLVLPQLSGSTLETLAGDAVPKGLVAEVDDRMVVSAVNAGAESRRDEFIAAKDLLRDIKSLHKMLGSYEPGSKIGLTPTPEGFTLDVSEATRIDRAAGLAEGDLIVVGPNIKPKTYLNARGKVVSIEGDKVKVALDPGDRDRLQRATAKPIAERLTLPRVCVEKVQ
jgi:hypothetical protein